MGPELFGSPASNEMEIEGQKSGKGYSPEDGRDQKPHHPLSKNSHLFPHRRLSVEEQGYRCLHKGEKNRIQDLHTGRQRKKITNLCYKAALMRLEGKDLSALPKGIHARAKGNHLAYAGIPVFHGKSEVSPQGFDSGINCHMGRDLVTINQEFAAGTDGRDDCPDQHFGFGRFRDRLFPEGHPAGTVKKKALSFHFLSPPGIGPEHQVVSHLLISHIDQPGEMGWP